MEGFENEKLTIKLWSVNDRPREKLLINGRISLSDVELIAILIGSGNRTDSAVELSRKILQDASNNLNQLGKYSVKDLIKFKGIGQAKAITILAALELGRRRKESEGLIKNKITGSNDVYQIIKPFLCDVPHEEFWIIALNRSNTVIKPIKISQGGITSTVVDTRLIFSKAMETLACSIILCHNHPSGNLKPSEEDLVITRKLIEAGKIMDIPVLDHLIYTDDGYFSFSDDGIL